MAEEEFTPTVPRVYSSEGQQLPSDKIKYQDVESDYMAGNVKFNKADKIPVISPYGEVGTIDATEFVAAQDAGFKLDTPDMQYKRHIEEKYSSSPELIKTALEGAARGLSVGLSDVALSKLGAETALRKEVNPITAGVTEVGGMFIPALLTGGTSASATGVKGAVQTAAKYTPIELITNAGRAVESAAAAKLGTSLASKVAPKVLAGATEGALFGSVGSLGEAALGDHELTAENVLANAGLGIVLGGSIGGVAAGFEMAKPMIERGMEKAKSGVGSVGKKAISTFFGLGEKDIDRLVDLSSRDQALAKLPPDAAREMLSAKSIEHAEKIMESKELLAQTGLELKEAKSLARDAFKAVKEERASEVSKSMYGVASDISTDVDKLLQSAIHKSSDIQKTLLLDGYVPVKDITSKLRKSAAEMAERGQDVHMRASDWLNNEAQKIEDLAQMTDKPGYLDAMTAKKRIMGLDDVITWDKSAAGYDAAANSAYKDTRLAIDKALKDHIPEYKIAMKDVANDFELAAKLKRYSEKDRAFNNLNKLSKAEAYEKDIQYLSELGDKFGKDYSKKAKSLLDELHVFKKSSEFEDLTNKTLFNEKLKDPQVMETIERTLSNSKEYKAMKEAILADKSAEMIRAGYDGLNASSIQGLFNKASRGDHVAINTIDKLGLSHEGRKLSEYLQDLGAVGRTGSHFTHGSKNVLSFGLMGEVLGGHFGMGMLFGAVVDKFGPKIAKLLVDNAINIAAMEKQGIDVAKKAAEHVNNFLGSKDLSQGISEKVIPITVRPEAKKEKKSKYTISQNEFNTIRERLSPFGGSPEVYADIKSRENMKVAEHAPNTAASLSQKQTVAAMFLQSKMPKDPLSQYYHSQSSSKWKPSDFELSKFSKYVETVHDPISALRDLNEGKLTPEKIETLKTVYPKLYSSIVNHMTERLYEEKPELDIHKRQQISLFLGAPISKDTDPKFLLEMQKNFAQTQDNTGSTQNFAASRVANFDISSKMSGTEKVSKRT